MAKQIFDIEWGPTWWECAVEIDDAQETQDAIKAMVEFWHGWENRLDNNEGDYTKTFLQQLGREINYIQAQEHCGIGGVLKAFESREGWAKMDGSLGITIMEVDRFDFDWDQYVVTERIAPTSLDDYEKV